MSLVDHLKEIETKNRNSPSAILYTQHSAFEWYRERVPILDKIVREETTASLETERIKIKLDGWNSHFIPTFPNFEDMEQFTQMHKIMGYPSYGNMPYIAINEVTGSLLGFVTGGLKVYYDAKRQVPKISRRLFITYPVLFLTIGNALGSGAKKMDETATRDAEQDASYFDSVLANLRKNGFYQSRK